MSIFDVEKPCPLCGEIGVGLAEDGEHAGIWRCKNDDCEKDNFVSSNMTFYPPHSSGWTWSNITEKMT